MAVIYLRSVLGRTLTSAEGDANIFNLNQELGQKLDSATYTSADILNKIKDVDGVGSGLDADLLDGMNSSSALPVIPDKSSVVSRDSSGNFSANVITANVNGSATTITSILPVSLGGTGSSSGTGLGLPVFSGSPELTGTPFAPTATIGTSTTQIATTAFVYLVGNTKANIDNPSFTGIPRAPTAVAGTSTTQIATTAFVMNANYAPINSPNLTGVPTSTTAVSTVKSTQIATTEFVQNAIPAGFTMDWAGPNNPPGRWLRCNGQEVSRSTYQDLFDAIGTTYGAGNGSTTFNLPDTRGRFVRDLDDGVNHDPGRVMGSQQEPTRIGSIVYRAASLQLYNLETNPVYNGTTPGPDAVGFNRAQYLYATRPINIALRKYIKY